MYIRFFCENRVFWDVTVERPLRIETSNFVLRLVVYKRQILQSFKSQTRREVGFPESRFSIFLVSCITALASFQQPWKRFLQNAFSELFLNRELRSLFNGVGGLRPPPPGGFAPGRRRSWFPGRACQRCDVLMNNTLCVLNLWIYTTLITVF